MLLKKNRIRRALCTGLAVALAALLWSPMEAAAALRLQNTGEKVVVVIDPGHGGENLGTTENGHEEKSMTLVTALAMYEELLLYEGVEVHMTRTEDKDMTLKERAEFAKSVDADFLFSIHYNASEYHDAYGSEVWVSMHPPYSGYGYQFGYEVLTQLRELGLLMRGVKTRPGEGGLDYYGIIRESVSLEIPAVIIEHCHVDEAHDEGFCGSAEQLELFGRMDATAVAKYFGLKSSVLNVDYSGHQLADTGSEEQLDALLNARTAPEICQIQFMDADYENGKLTLSVSGADHDSALLYYSYSIDGGETFCKRETWPEGDGLSGSYRDSFVLELDIPPGVCPEVVVRAYNGFDIYTESNHYESPMAFPFPPAVEEPSPVPVPSPEVQADSDQASVEFKDLDTVIAVVMFTIAVVLTMMLVVQILEVKRRRRRRQNYNRQISQEREGRGYYSPHGGMRRDRYYQSRNEDG